MGAMTSTTDAKTATQAAQFGIFKERYLALGVLCRSA
jgi:hypothetical protein